jgi:hypothetical protein
MCKLSPILDGVLAVKLQVGPETVPQLLIAITPHVLVVLRVNSETEQLVPAKPEHAVAPFRITL